MFNKNRIGINLLDKWWNGLTLSEKRDVMCNAHSDCCKCPLLRCPNCDDNYKLKVFIEAAEKGEEKNA